MNRPRPFSDFDLSTFWYSLVQWLIDMTYRSIYYIISIIFLLILPVYTGWRESVSIKSFHYFLELAKFGFGLKINAEYLFEHSFEKTFLEVIVMLAGGAFALSIFYVIRSFPPIRLYVAQIGRDLYSEKRLGYGKDDTGRFNANMRGKKVGLIRQLIYTVFKIGADVRSPSHIPQEPLEGSPYPKSGFFYDYSIRNHNLIGNKLGETYYVSTLEARYIISASCICGLITLIGIKLGYFNDIRYMSDILTICFFGFSGTAIAHILSLREVDENKLVNDFSPKEEGFESGVELGSYFKNRHKTGE